MRTLLLCFLMAPALASQEPPPLSIKVDVNLINVAFIVRDTAPGAANSRSVHRVSSFIRDLIDSVSAPNKRSSLCLNAASLERCS
jgi:hypothetical protein